MARKIALRGTVALGLVVMFTPCLRAGNSAERRGEIGFQIGFRLADNDVVPEDNNGLAFAYGIEGVWAFNLGRGFEGSATVSVGPDSACNTTPDDSGR